jgi:hypothetical protein
MKAAFCAVFYDSDRDICIFGNATSAIFHKFSGTRHFHFFLNFQENRICALSHENFFRHSAKHKIRSGNRRNKYRFSSKLGYWFLISYAKLMMV